MPARSLTSSVFKWPDAKAVDEAVRRWAQQTVAGQSEVMRRSRFGQTVAAEAVWVYELREKIT